MRRLNIEIGSTFGKLTIIKETESKNNKRRFICECECGQKKVFNLGNLIQGRSKSCGCDTKTNSISSSTKHSMRYSSEYVVWCNMKQRCYNKNHKHFRYYGGRGIEVCEQWQKSFQQFYEDMGQRPLNLTLDRINVDGNYEPTNCRWATHKQQSQNRRICQFTKMQ